MPPPDYRFDPPARSDLPVLRRWRDAPHVRRWWPDFQVEIDDVETGAAPPGFTTRIVREAAGTAFARIQDYDLAIWPAPHMTGLPEGTRGMDTMIGEAAFLGRGHAPQYIRQRAEDLLAEGVPALVVDPYVANPRAVRAWRAAGFAGDRIAAGEGGRPVLILTFARQTARAPETA